MATKTVERFAVVDLQVDGVHFKAGARVEGKLRESTILQAIKRGWIVEQSKPKPKPAPAAAAAGDA
jgi:hypothetical protein